MTPEWIGLTLSSAAAIVGIFWYLKFRRVLPLEQALARERGRAAQRDALAQELLEARSLPGTPQAFSEALQSGVDRFLKRSGGLHVFVWVRMSATGSFPEVQGDLVCRTGVLQSVEPDDLRIPDEFWDRAFGAPGQARWNGDLPAALGRLFEPHGLRSLRLVPWGTPGRVWGLLGALDSTPGGAVLSRFGEELSILTASFGSLADHTGQFWELDHAREQLEGGLSVTMRRLDETNLRLIQRARQIKTLKEVTEVITEHPDQPDILSAIVSIVARALEADLCAFLLLDESGGELVTQPGAFGFSVDEGALYRISLNNDDASSVRVFRSGEPFLTGDAQSDPRVIARYAKLWKCHSLMVVPLRVEGGRIGVMRVGSFKKNFFNQDHLQLVRLIAEEAAVIVESAVLSKQLAEMNRQLTQLHRLKDDFVSTVSHEFKTPLTSIQGFLSVVLGEEAGPLTVEQKRFLAITKAASDRLSLLVNDMLDLSKLEAGVKIELEPTELEAVAKKAIENQRWQAEERGIRISVDSPGGLPRVRGNEQWLTQVFDNLISNAVKFTPERGRVTVSIVNKGECLMAGVADSGIGIPERDRRRIFEKFFRASNRGAVSAPGTGLGLAICKQIIDRHAGRIWFESDEGEGTRFFFVIPVAREGSAVASKQREFLASARPQEASPREGSGKEGS
ncbi:MAG: GAF domain-containing sensor histidine kinase [Elusimicrobiota bacterium]